MWFRRVLASALALLPLLADAVPQDCIEDGGHFRCSGRDARPQSWNYQGLGQGDKVRGNECGNCANGFPVAVCAALNGTGGGCVGCNNPDPLTEANIVTVDIDVAEWAYGTCSFSTQDLGWRSNSDGDCGPEPPPVEWQYGVEVTNMRYFRHEQLGGTCNEGTYHNTWKRDRWYDLMCSPGAVLTAGNQYCTQADDNTCPINNPVQPGRGGKKHTETDFAASDPSPLRFTRNYNSFGYWRPRYSGTSHFGGLFGYYWRTNYDRQLYAVSGSTFVMAAVYRPDGRVKYFKHSGDEVHPGADGPADRLQAIAGVQCGQKPTPPPTTVAWRYTSGKDEVESYNCSGQLLTIVDRDNRKQQLTWESSGRLASIADDQGRTITFAYAGESRRLISVTDPNGKVYGYGYDDKDRLTSVSYPGATTSRQYHYEDGNYWYALTGITDELGVRFATYTYDSTGRVTSSVHAPEVAGGTIDRYQYFYNHGGDPNKARIMDPLGTERIYTFSDPLAGSGGPVRLLSVSQPCTTCGSLFQSRTYDGNGYPLTSTDFRSTITEYTYDAKGREELRMEASNATCSGQGCRTEKRTIDPAWSASFNVMTQRTVANDLGTLESKTTYAYNGRGQVTARCEIDLNDGAANAYAAQYGCSATVAPTTDRVRRWVHTYCESGGGCPIVGQLLSINGPRHPTDAGMQGIDDLTTFSYYTSSAPTGCEATNTCTRRAGDLYRVTNALGHFTEYVTRDGSGRVTRMKDENLVITDFVYDDRGRVLSRIERANLDGSASSGDAITSFVYDAAGNLKELTPPNGATLYYNYDSAHRLTSILDRMGNTIDYCVAKEDPENPDCLDPTGRRRSEHYKNSSDQTRRSIRREFDALGRLQVLRNAQGDAVSTTSYDGNGNPLDVEDALGHNTLSTYDRLNRLITQIGDADAGGIQATTHFGYDARDNLVHVEDPNGLSTTYTYDKLGDLTQLVSPDTGTTDYAYDGAGNRTSKTYAPAAGQTHLYDALNRLRQTQYLGGLMPSIDRMYDQNHTECPIAERFGVGRLTSVSDGSGETKFCYDQRGNVVRRIWQAASGPTLTTRWTYNNADQLFRTYYPSGAVATVFRHLDGRARSVRFTPAGQLTPQFVVETATYEPFGPLKSIPYGLSPTHTQTLVWDQDYQPLSVSGTATGALSLGYETDPRGNVESIRAPASAPSPSQLYVHDGLGRLTAVQSGSAAPIESYTYDDTGNRTSRTTTANTDVYTYYSQTHRLAQAGSRSIYYKPWGSPSSISDDSCGIGAEIHSDPEGRYSGFNGALRCEHAQSYLVADSTFDFQAQRVAKYVTNIVPYEQSATWYAYGTAGQLLGEYNQLGQALREYIWLEERPAGIADGLAVYHVLADHLGTPRSVVDPASTTTIWSWPYLDNAFGDKAPITDPDGNQSHFQYNLRFPGQYYDAESGLHYNYFRDYEPTTGRYIESDPIGLDGGINTYSYALGNPIRFTDPTGEAAAVVRLVPPAGFALAGAAVCALHPELCRAAIEEVCADIVESLSPFDEPYRAQWPLDAGGEEWGRRNGVGADEGRRRAHKVKQADKGRPKDRYTVDPHTGDVYDPEGEWVGNLNNG